MLNKLFLIVTISFMSFTSAFAFDNAKAGRDNPFAFKLLNCFYDRVYDHPSNEQWWADANMIHAAKLAQQPQCMQLGKKYDAWCRMQGGDPNFCIQGVMGGAQIAIRKYQEETGN